MRPLVVVADDEPMARRALGEALRRAKYLVRELSSGDEVLPALRDTRPALVILDLLLPGVDGHSLLVEIKGDPSLQDIPVVLTSGEPAEIHESVGRDLGAAAFLAKPFDAASVVSVVSKALKTVAGGQEVPTTPAL